LEDIFSSCRLLSVYTGDGKLVKLFDDIFSSSNFSRFCMLLNNIHNRRYKKEYDTCDIKTVEESAHRQSSDRILYMLFLLDISFSYKYFSALQYFTLIDRLSDQGGQLLLIPSI